MNEFLANFSYASIASVLCAATSYPLDTLKSNMQNDNKKYKGLVRSAYLMYKEFGIRGFYRGFYSDLGIIMFQNAFTMTCYEMILKYLEKQSSNQFLNVFVSGCLSEVPLLTFLVPLEYVKVLQQCDQSASRENIIDHKSLDSNTSTKKNPPKIKSAGEITHTSEKIKFKPLIEFVREVINHRGFTGLFRGFWITFNRDFISGGVYFLAYYSCKLLSNKNLSPDSPFYSLVTFGLSGGIAGGISWLVTHPFDTIKTIIQMGDLKKETLKQKEVIDSLFKEGYVKGILSSYRGGFSSFLCYVVGCSTFFIVYEKLKIESNSI